MSEEMVKSASSGRGEIKKTIIGQTRMNNGRITELLDKYWACETSISEEMELQEFFRSAMFPKSCSHMSRSLHTDVIYRP